MPQIVRANVEQFWIFLHIGLYYSKEISKYVLKYKLYNDDIKMYYYMYTSVVAGIFDCFKLAIWSLLTVIIFTAYDFYSFLVKSA